MMRKCLTVGILSEDHKPGERRSPLIPQDVSWLIQRGIPVEVLASGRRVFGDNDFRKVGAKIVSRFQKAGLLIGIKEPKPSTLIHGKVYCLFSHTAKGQVRNRPLLTEAITKRITLADYEYIQDRSGQRTVYFGRFAGICGMIDSLHYLGKRLQWMGAPTPLLAVKTSMEYMRWKSAAAHFSEIYQAIKEKGFPGKYSPFVVGITGHGNVSQGAQEILDLWRPTEIHPADAERFVRSRKKQRKRVYKIVFTREEKLRAKDGSGFYFEEYLKYPGRFESNLDRYLPCLTLLIHGSYWDKRYPRLVTDQMVRRVCRRKDNRLALIGDLTCDVKGAIEITRKTASPAHPTFVYDPATDRIKDGWAGKGLAVLAVDNLPSEMAYDASEEFSGMIRDYVYQMAAHGVTDLTRHHALPLELRKAVICEDGKLTGPFRYLR